MTLSQEVVVPALKEFVHQLEAIRRDAEDLLSGLTDEQLLARPAPGGWSVAECLQHLNITAAQSLPLLDRAIAETKAKNLYSRGPFRTRLLAGWFIRSLEPPPRLRTKTSTSFVPPEDLDPETVKVEFMRFQDELQRRLHEVNGLHLTRMRVPSPFARFISYTLLEFFAVLLARERRHLWQAREAARSLAKAEVARA